MLSGKPGISTACHLRAVPGRSKHCNYKGVMLMCFKVRRCVNIKSRKWTPASTHQRTIVILQKALQTASVRVWLSECRKAGVCTQRLQPRCEHKAQVWEPTNTHLSPWSLNRSNKRKGRGNSILFFGVRNGTQELIIAKSYSHWAVSLVHDWNFNSYGFIFKGGLTWDNSRNQYRYSALSHD